ncbi:MAG TPA: DUF5658 family protein [Vicinamibacterales bacterium]|nr:DUF5658 family protein [Vicinamibacterales bacterium]
MPGLLAACTAAVALAQPVQLAQPHVTEPSILARSANQDLGQLIVPVPSSGRVASSPARSKLLTASYVSFIALEALDAHSTLRVLANGGREANPVLRGVVGQPAAFIAVKAAGGATAIWATEKLRRKHPRGAFVLMVVLNSALATVVAHNYSLQ